MFDRGLIADLVRLDCRWCWNVVAVVEVNGPHRQMHFDQSSIPHRPMYSQIALHDRVTRMENSYHI